MTWTVARFCTLTSAAARTTSVAAVMRKVGDAVAVLVGGRGVRVEVPVAVLGGVPVGLDAPAVAVADEVGVGMAVGLSAGVELGIAVGLAVAVGSGSVAVGEGDGVAGHSASAAPTAATSSLIPTTPLASTSQAVQAVAFPSAALTHVTSSLMATTPSPPQSPGHGDACAGAPHHALIRRRLAAMADPAFFATAVTGGTASGRTRRGYRAGGAIARATATVVAHFHCQDRR
jgi:hypothetical protein